MNAALPAKVLQYPVAGDKSIKDKRPSWWIRAGVWIGTLKMAPPPKVWSFNPSVITLLLLIAGILTSAGYYIGRQATIIEGIQKTADEAKATAVVAKDIAINGGEETPTPTPEDKNVIKTKTQKGQ